MPDIAMCENSLCPSRSLCYRFTAIADTFQSYEIFKVPDGRDYCDYYSWNGEHKKREEMKEIIEDDGDF